MTCLACVGGDSAIIVDLVASSAAHPVLRPTSRVRLCHQFITIADFNPIGARFCLLTTFTNQSIAKLAKPSLSRQTGGSNKNK